MQLPFAPPIPELVIATMARWFRFSRGMTSVGARSRYSSHLMAGLGVVRFTVGGMSPVSKIERTLLRDARKAAISRWLGNDQNRASLGHVDVPDVAFHTPNQDVAITLEQRADPVRFRWVTAARPGRMKFKEINILRR
jgi:hypothetical protein